MYSCSNLVVIGGNWLIMQERKRKPKNKVAPWGFEAPLQWSDGGLSVCCDSVLRTIVLRTSGPRMTLLSFAAGRTLTPILPPQTRVFRVSHASLFSFQLHSQEHCTETVNENFTPCMWMCECARSLCFIISLPYTLFPVFYKDFI